MARLLLAAAILLATVARRRTRGDENPADAIRSLREQVSALLEHRQQDYEALERSLKRAVEKNTELFVLKDQIEQLRKEVAGVRGGSGNEARNERLRVRWLGNAVTELRGEVADVLRARNASAELADRSRMMGELALLRTDVAALGTAIRSLAGRIAEIEAAIGTSRVDVAAVKERFGQLSRSCADLASQVAAIRIEATAVGSDASSLRSSEVRGPERVSSKRSRERERWSSLSGRVKSLEKRWAKAMREMRRVGEEASESVAARLAGSLATLEEAVEANASSIRAELRRLDASAARNAAALSVTRDQLTSLRGAVRALGATAFELEERGEEQREAIERLNEIEEEPALPARAEESAPAGCEGKRAPDGLRLFRPDSLRRPIPVFCRDGWTVVARRTDGSLDFDRSWNDYALGFGSPLGEYWIGNELLHRLTRDNCTELRIDMADIEGRRWRAEYRAFAVESAASGYRLRVRGYAGNASDALSYQDGMPFSAKDRDMDASSAHCARTYHGGWWFGRCQHANLNARYSLGLTWYRSDTDRWMSIVSSEMAIRRDASACPSP